jgi:hypothetical protein
VTATPSQVNEWYRPELSAQVSCRVSREPEQSIPPPRSGPEAMRVLYIKGGQSIR